MNESDQKGLCVAEKASKNIETDRRLLRFAANFLASQALALLNDRTAGASEIAAEFGVSEAASAELLEDMCEVGLIEVVKELPGKAPRYRAMVRSLLGDQEWSQLTYEERQRMSAWVVQLISSDAAEAIEAGSFDARMDGHVSRTLAVVDERGWRELARIQEKSLEAVFAVQAASAERLAESGTEGITAMNAMLCFEMPPPRARGA